MICPMRLVSLISIPEKVVKQLRLDTISRHMKDGKLIMSREHRLMKQKLCLTNQIDFHNKVTNNMQEDRCGCCFSLHKQGVCQSFPLNPHR